MCTLAVAPATFLTNKIASPVKTAAKLATSETAARLATNKTAAAAIIAANTVVAAAVTAATTTRLTTTYMSTRFPDIATVLLLSS